MEAWKEELYHHGILGMKWGVRRFQRADGTRTAAGKKREAAQESQESSSEESPVSKYRKSDVKTLSDKELKDRVARMNMEKLYAEHLDRISKADRTKGQVFIEDYVKPAAERIGKDYTEKIMRSFTDPLFSMVQDKVKSASSTAVEKAKAKNGEDSGKNDDNSKETSSKKSDKKQKDKSDNSKEQPAQKEQGQDKITININNPQFDKQSGNAKGVKSEKIETRPVEKEETRQAPKQEAPKEVLNGPPPTTYNNTHVIDRSRTLASSTRYEDMITDSSSIQSAKDWLKNNS